jgi:hypothetical protein
MYEDASLASRDTGAYVGYVLVMSITSLAITMLGVVIIVAALCLRRGSWRVGRDEDGNNDGKDSWRQATVVFSRVRKRPGEKERQRVEIHPAGQPPDGRERRLSQESLPPRKRQQYDDEGAAEEEDPLSPCGTG